VLLILLAVSFSPASADTSRTVWGYVDSVDGASVTLDDGTVLRLTDATKVINTDGSEGTPADIAKGLKIDFTLDAAGNVTRAELLPRPLAPEFYLTTLTVRGATTVAAETKGRVYPRSLSAVKATFPVRGDCFALVGGVAYLPSKDAKAPASVRFSVVNAANDPLYQRALNAGESADFRLNLTPGQADTFTLLASAPGDAALQPEWCLWLDPRLVGAGLAPTGMTVYQPTVRALLADLQQGLQSKQPGPMTVALFNGYRINDDQILRFLQEDLVVVGVGQFQMVGKSNQRPELGTPLNDGQKGELVKLGAKCVLTGSVSYRGDGMMVNAALVDIGTNEILATARAWQ